MSKYGIINVRKVGGSSEIYEKDNFAFMFNGYFYVL